MFIFIILLFINDKIIFMENNLRYLLQFVIIEKF